MKRYQQKQSRSSAPRGVLLVQLMIAAGVVTGLGWLPTGQAQAVEAASQAVTQRQYDIPAGPLGGALARFGSESGVALVGATQAVQGKSSPGLKGSYTVQQGFAALLQGTGLEAVQQADGSYGLRALPQDMGEAVLAPVTVMAKHTNVTEGTGSYTIRSTSAATGMNLSLRETPQSVTVITRERMDEQGLNSLSDALSEVTGVHAGPMGTAVGGYVGISARGYTINNYQVDGLAAAYVDGFAVHSFGNPPIFSAVQK